MDIQIVKSKIQGRKARPEGRYRRFSVLVPIVKVKDELELLFEIRSETLRTQPREICFPGGKIEKNESAQHCAIRETCEELNLTSNNIEILGRLDYLVMPYNLILYPYAGSLMNVKVEEIQFNRDEVSDIFTVPIKYFMDNPPLEHYVDLRTYVDEGFPFHMIQNGKDYHWRTGKHPVLFYAYGNHIIWGMTARIVKNFINILKDNI
ncbi:CoA pyrophosphatase [Clostridiaceae bacterium 35-E11]